MCPFDGHDWATAINAETEVKGHNFYSFSSSPHSPIYGSLSLQKSKDGRIREAKFLTSKAAISKPVGEVTQLLVLSFHFP